MGDLNEAEKLVQITQSVPSRITMPKCIDCGAYTKYHKGRCYPCHRKSKSFPAHAEFYKGLHKIYEEMIQFIFHCMDWQIHKETLFKRHTTTTAAHLEKYSWDLMVEILATPECRLKKPKGGFYNLFIEYKSSIKEWGKNIDDYFRQINKKKERNHLKHTFLVSFDQRFEEYRQACRMAGINLIVLPQEFLEKMRR